MNDQPPATIMNQQPPQLMSQPPPIPVMNPVQPPPPPISIQSQMLSHSQAMNQPQPLMMMNQRPYKKFQNQQQNPLKYNNNFVPSKPRSSSNNNNWKGKNVNNNKRMENSNNNPALSGGGGYKPPSLNDLQTQNRMKARKYYHPKKKFNNRFAPYAPRNTTSFIIRAKKSGGIASLVSPCPVTPAVLPTPIFSPSREVLGDMAKEEWGVDGYGSMKGLIRLRSPGNEANEDEEDEEGNGSSESDVEEHVEVERRLDHDLSRFEMIYPSGGGGEYSYNNVLENRVDDQDTHIAQLEEENLTLKERLFLMERELGDLRRRLQFLERQQHHHHGQSSSAMVVEDVNEEVVENVSENDENENESDGVSDIGGNTGGDGNEEVMEYVGGNGERRNVGDGGKEESNDVCMEENVPDDHLIVKHKVKDEKATSGYVGDDEVVGNDEVIIKENEVKGGERGDWFVPTDAETGKDDGAKDEERGIEVLLDRLVAKEEEEPVQG
ncbi:midasin-like [Populus alba x Populus x berolinensis]|uniref:Midasin-like n=1 Tax=Populus alba x Populus x berolinensis TaxID=444605 RepID=A0AAD6WA98_9ROSI|nr:midasin-like [Populus alba x Populus x berolinensis]